VEQGAGAVAKPAIKKKTTTAAPQKKPNSTISHITLKRGSLVLGDPEVDYRTQIEWAHRWDNYYTAMLDGGAGAIVDVHKYGRMPMEVILNEDEEVARIVLHVDKTA
jgi:hypothetical protein